MKNTNQRASRHALHAMFSNSWVPLLTSAFLLALPSAAAAAPRTVCFTLNIEDQSRQECPQPGTAGIRRACQADNNGTNQDWMIGWKLEAYDKDPGGFGNDDYIGTWQIGGSGQQCITFEWENAGYFFGETDGPDVYMVLQNTVTSTAGAASVHLISSSGGEYTKISWRISDTNNAATAVNCQPNTNNA